MNTHDKIDMLPLPEWSEAESSVKNGVATALDIFIHGNEPAGDDELEWREELEAAIRAAVEADHKRRGEPVAFEIRYKSTAPASVELTPYPAQAEEARGLGFEVHELVRRDDAQPPVEPCVAPTLHNADSGAQNEDQAPQPAEPVHPGYKAAFDALRYYVDASDKELAERGITRDEALRLARVEEFKLSQLAEPVKVPSDSAIMAKWASTPNTGDMRIDLLVFARALLACYGAQPSSKDET